MRWMSLSLRTKVVIGLYNPMNETHKKMWGEQGKKDLKDIRAHWIGNLGEEEWAAK